VPPAEARAAAPTLTVYGLQIGKSPAADMEAWLTAHGLTCPPAPSPRRTTTRYVCTGDIPVTVLPDRVVKGKIDQVLLVRGDNGPLRHFSSSRKYSLPTDAVADYSSALTALTSTFGIPTIVAPAPAPTLAFPAWLFLRPEVFGGSGAQPGRPRFPANSETA
jgi:hypothetical protein